MKFLITLLLSVVTCFAQSGHPNKLLTQKRNAADTLTVISWVAFQTNMPGFYFMDGTNIVQSCGVFGDGFYFDGYGTVKVSQASIGLDQVANLAPADLPVSTATQAALDTKSDTNHSHSYLALTDLPTIPTVKTSYMTNLVTDSSGNLTWTFPAPFASPPHVVVSALSTNTGAYNVQKVSITTSNVVVKAQRQVSINIPLLSLDLLQFSPDPQCTVHFRAEAP